MAVTQERPIIRPEDVLNETEYALWRRVQDGELACPNPRCSLTSKGAFYFFLQDEYQYKGIQLYCEGCEFREW